RLAFRRALAPAVHAGPAVPAVIGAWILLALFGLTRDWAGTNALLQTAGEGGDPGAAARGMLREGVWTILAISILPLLVFRTARSVSVWRSGESEWLASRGVGRGAILVSTWIGTWAGGATLLALACLAIELRAGAAAPSLRRGPDLALPSGAFSSRARIGSRGPLAWTAPDTSAIAGARARVQIGFVSGAGSAGEILFRAKRDRDERTGRARISSHGSIEVELPPGSGAIGFELSCASPGTTAVVLSDAVEVWSPCASDRAAGVEILIRILVAFAAWTALALGLAAWVSPSIASLAILAAWIPAWLGDIAPRWLPGADLWDALSIVGMGRVPAALDSRAFAVGTLLALVGLALAAVGLRSWRGSA
ncbi:MAG TPA: hypothetical protein VKF32_15205, partial [Thermoanaerobaculia bacterium]|nr:hypothetical protein [Thermoanaerobaculia bacterium]